MPDPRRKHDVHLKLSADEATWLAARVRLGARPRADFPHPPSRSGLLRELVRLAMKDPEVEKRLMARLSAAGA